MKLIRQPISTTTAAVGPVQEPIPTTVENFTEQPPIAMVTPEAATVQTENLPQQSKGVDEEVKTGELRKVSGWILERTPTGVVIRPPSQGEKAKSANVAMSHLGSGGGSVIVMLISTPEEEPEPVVTAEESAMEEPKPTE